MANQRDIKRRIGSVANTQKITRAMKLVSAAKFARASHAVNASRPYSDALDKMVEKLVSNSSDPIESPLTEVRPNKTAALVVVATDRGLCGSLNAALFKEARKWLSQQKDVGVKVNLIGWGRKAASWAKKQPEGLTHSIEKVTEKPSFMKARELCQELVEEFVSEKVDQVHIAYNVFQNALTQTPTIRSYLPVAVDPSTAAEIEEPNESSDFIVEPELSAMVEDLLTSKLNIALYQVFLDACASEHGSRMTAMDNATNNAGEVRKKLTLKYNRARQASITKELIEIVSGAEAL